MGVRGEKEGFMAACKFVHQGFLTYQLHLLSWLHDEPYTDSAPALSFRRCVRAAMKRGFIFGREKCFSSC